MNKKLLFLILGSIAILVILVVLFMTQGATAPEAEQEEEQTETEMEELDLEEISPDPDAEEPTPAPPKEEDPEPAPEEPTEEEPTPPTYNVSYTSSGYSPSTVTISQGDTVTFVNNSSSDMWTASAFHPTHTVYPGSDITKCGTGAVIFDACEGTPPGGSWSFTFNEIGEWSYHNHLLPGQTGTIVVQ